MCLKVYMPPTGTCSGCEAAHGAEPHPYATNVNQTWAWNATVYYDALRSMPWFYGIVIEWLDRYSRHKICWSIYPLQ